MSEVRRMPRSEVLEWFTMEAARQEYEQEVEESQIKRQQRRQDTNK